MLKKARSFFLPLALVISVVGIGVIGPAHATTYYFSFEGIGIVDTTGSVTASGVLTTGALDSANSLNTPPGFDITAITGTYNGYTITGLISPATCAASAPCNLLIPPPNDILYYPGTPYLDAAGLVFSDANGDIVNLFGNSSSDYGASAFDASGDESFFDGTFTASTPLPDSMLLLGGVLAAGFFVAKWRRRHRYRSAGA